MKVRYKFENNSLFTMADRLKEVIELIKPQVVDVREPFLSEIELDKGWPYIDLKVTMSPAQVMQALERAGYEGDVVVGINNAGKVIFEDELNDMFIVGEVFIEFKNGRLEAEHGQATDADTFQMFTGF